ncbi:hypothetical protein HN51_053185 [Arachis hypogaea]|uniref:Riboflavin biosynthesis protein PYRD, chloroplastic n=1 Tax=Arachis hypogaea TaxID=3818 RepID=A0A444XBP7_ARAHY|nr:riboflavin biosynthesis protein PYRD, chloroplastic [Arachis ipaensis]XP_025657148.1 riboflavin biosynthesis protein PYRD, chloroplastic [Arachis hypogaea]QHN75540.1 Riboflavin biosynthesis protein PYRD [Arachis hypogaea]RYQ87131.1 hypothetical protein Ahy_B09g094603 [Arachis hypogaea]
MQAQLFSLPHCTLRVPRFLNNASPPNFATFQQPHHSSKLSFNVGLNHLFQKSIFLSQSVPGLMSSYDGYVGVVAQCGISNGESDVGDCDDGFYIRRCVQLARKAIGFTSPNPMVGCVIVKDGKIVGQGFHPKAGQPHAEVFALRDAGDLAENATAYVSLEPCNHFGKTPPCTEALIKAKVKKVVVGMVDPNPLVESKGLARLRDAGIEVVVGVEEELCKSLNEAFVHRMLTGKPLLTLRYSLSVNGNFLDLLGDEVTECGGYYSRLLQEYDAVILSSSLFSGNISIPSSQEPGANQPIRIVIHKDSSSSNEIPLAVNEVTDKVIVFTDNGTATAPELAKKGIETVILDQINLDVILDYCNQQGMCSVLLDLRGNSSEFEELVKEGIQKKNICKFVTEILPIWNRGSEIDPLIPVKRLDQGIQVENLKSKCSDQNVIIEGHFKF